MGLLDGELLVISECNLDPPEDQYMFLTSEASLQPQGRYFVKSPLKKVLEMLVEDVTGSDTQLSVSFLLGIFPGLCCWVCVSPGLVSVCMGQGLQHLMLLFLSFYNTISKSTTL